MDRAPYICRCLPGNVHVITCDAPSVRMPWIIRTTWMPTSEESSRLAPDWCDGSPATPIRDQSKTVQRWHLAPPQYGFHAVEISTHAEGTHAKVQVIKAPTTRTPGAWYAWETGEWKRYLPGCVIAERLRRADSWHTPLWCPGTNMAPLPPTDYEHAQRKGTP